MSTKSGKTVNKVENKIVESVEPKKPKAAASTKTPKQPDNKRQLALESAAHAGLVAYFPQIAGQNVYEKLASALNLHILEAIDNIQKLEVSDKNDYNPYPSDKYMLLADKTGSSSKKKSVNSRSSAKSSAILRGQRPEENKEAADSGEDVEDDLKDVKDVKDVTDENKEETTTKKKNVVTFSKNTKTYLGFLMSRFVDEVATATQKSKSVKDNDSFTKFVFESVPKEISSHLSRHVVCSVNRLRSSVGYMQDRHISNLLVDSLSSEECFSGKTTLLKMVGEYISDYFKLLGHTLSLFCWSTCKSVNHQNLETTMRLLDMGNYEYSLSNNLLEENAPQLGLSNGVLQDMHKFDELLNPPKSDEEKKKEAEERSKKKSAKQTETEADEDLQVDVEEEAEVEEPKKVIKKITSSVTQKK
jgi:hypothetical protein